MFILSDNYFIELENVRVCNFYGRVGSFKTLSAVASAYTLLQTKRYKRCYANIPVTFASSPPEGIDKFDFLSLEYAQDSIFIIDESALFLSGKHEEVSRVFAFPRKLNQIFLLASVLPTRQIESYCHLFCTRGLNFAMIGIPLLQFKTHAQYKVVEKEKVAHYLFGYSRYFQKYASKFRPASMYPIKQYRDSGVLYDAQSREIPGHLSKYFVVNAWGQAIKKQHLPLDIVDEIGVILPEFEVLDLDKNDYPVLRQKITLNPLGSEFKFSFFLYFLSLIYVFFIMAKFLSQALPTDPPPQKWTACQYINILQGKAISDCGRIAKDEILPKVKPTAQIIKYDIQTK